MRASQASASGGAVFYTIRSLCDRLVAENRANSQFFRLSAALLYLRLDVTRFLAVISVLQLFRFTRVSTRCSDKIFDPPRYEATRRNARSAKTPALAGGQRQRRKGIREDHYHEILEKLADRPITRLPSHRGESFSGRWPINYTALSGRNSRGSPRETIFRDA